ncbi:hypothetical protein D3C77_277470 [compost metagenome]
MPGSAEVRAASSRKPLERLFTTTPTWRTCSGSFGSARATRFWTSTWAVSRSVPGSNATVMDTAPSEVEDEVM